MTDYEPGDVVTCSNCGNDVVIDDDSYAICYGTPDSDFHSQRTLARPCGMCAEPITTAEYCSDCADEFDSTAVAPIWGNK